MKNISAIHSKMSIFERFIAKESPEKPVRDLFTPLKRVLEQLLPEIEQGSYQFLIGDDASGRIPTLILRDVIGGIYAKEQRPVPQTFFFAGSSHLEDVDERNKKLALMVESLKARAEQSRGKKALIVTDNIASGNSIKVITEALQQLQVEYDIVAVGTTSSLKILGSKLGGRVIAGQDSIPSIYGRKDLSGIQKTSEAYLYASPLKDDLTKSNMVSARLSAKSIAERLSSWYRSTLEKEKWKPQK